MIYTIFFQGHQITLSPPLRESFEEYHFHRRINIDQRVHRPVQSRSAGAAASAGPLNMLAKREHVTCLPWARELFFVFRLSASHPICWHNDRFVVSGLGFSICSSVVIAWCVANIVGRLTSPKILSVSLTQFRLGSSIEAELRAFVLVLALAFNGISAILGIALASKRNEIASVFNHLLYLWNR